MGKIHLVIFLLVVLPLVPARSVRKDFSADSKESFPPRPRVNKYIRDVYKRVRRNEDGTMNIEIQKQNTKVDAIYGYQVVKGSQSWGVNRARFDFNTSDLRRNDTVMAAEFILTARRGFPSQPVNVTILVRRESDNQTAFEPLGWQIFHWVPRRLLIFDVKQAVEYWRVAQKARGELKVRMKKVGASWQAGSTHAKSAFRRGPTKGPFLVVYLRSPGENGTSPSLVELVKKQSVLLPETIPIMYNTKYVSQKLSPNMPVKVRGRPRAGYNRFLPSCRKSSLSLVLTRFFIWLIEPSTPIKVGMCYGLCFAPIDSSLMPTRHAVIMADLLKSRGIREPSRPHCVPLELTGLTVLFLDEETRTTKVQVWDNSVVKKCGCR